MSKESDDHRSDTVSVYEAARGFGVCWATTLKQRRDHRPGLPGDVSDMQREGDLRHARSMRIFVLLFARSRDDTRPQILAALYFGSLLVHCCSGFVRKR